MATTFTPNYNLGMQKDHADKFDMDVITDNMEIIDTALSNKQDTTFTSYTTDSSETTITSSTTVQDAIEQLDYRTATNKTNISSIQDQFKRSATAINDTIANSATSGTLYGVISLSNITDAWGALNTYVMNSEGSRAIQVLFTENRNLRRFKGSGGWGAWTEF